MNRENLRTMVCLASLVSLVQCGAHADESSSHTVAPTGSDDEQRAGGAAPTDSAPQQGPPMPGPVPENRCVAMATVTDVLESSIEASERRHLPSDARDDVVLLVLQIEASEPASEALPSLCPAEGRLEVHASDETARDLRGRRVTAELELRGDTVRRVWFLHSAVVDDNGEAENTR